MKRFQEDFMFQLTESEWQNLNTKENTERINRSQFVTSSQKHRPKCILPYAFSEQGVAMPSGVLHSDRAVNVNIAIM
jgi:ORF6N domain